MKLVKFLLKDWLQSMPYTHLFVAATILFFNCRSQFFRLSLKDGLIKCVFELVCDQDEADTKVILCTNLAAALGVSTACISTVNSDIAIYALYFATQISIPMYIKIGTSDRRRCIDVRNEIALENRFV